MEEEKEQRKEVEEGENTYTKRTNKEKNKDFTNAWIKFSKE